MSEGPTYLSKMDLLALPDGRYLVAYFEAGSAEIYRVDPSKPQVQPYREEEGANSVTAEKVLHKVIVAGPGFHQKLPEELLTAATGGQSAPGSDLPAHTEESPQGQPGDTQDHGGNYPEKEAAEYEERVRSWLEGELPSLEGITVEARSHDGTSGVSMDLDKRDMGNGLFQGAKAVISDIEASEYHAGWADDGCNTCGKKDGEGWYFFPDKTVMNL